MERLKEEGAPKLPKRTPSSSPLSSRRGRGGGNDAASLVWCPIHASIVDSRTPFIAQIDAKLWRRTCHPLSTFHLLSAPSARTSAGLHRAPRARWVKANGVLAARMVGEPRLENLGKPGVNLNRPIAQALGMLPLFLAESNNSPREIEVSDFRPHDFRPAPLCRRQLQGRDATKELCRSSQQSPGIVDFFLVEKEAV